MNVYSLDDIQSLTLKSAGAWMRALSSGLTDNKRYVFKNKEEITSWILGQQEFVLQCVFDFYYQEHMVGLTVKEHVLEQVMAGFNHDKTLEGLVCQTKVWEDRFDEKYKAQEEAILNNMGDFYGFDFMDIDKGTETSIEAKEEEVADFVRKSCQQFIERAESLCQALGRVTKQGMQSKQMGEPVAPFFQPLEGKRKSAKP